VAHNILLATINWHKGNKQGKDLFLVSGGGTSAACVCVCVVDSTCLDRTTSSGLPSSPWSSPVVNTVQFARYEIYPHQNIIRI
jgi:hypothetical protein